MLFELETDKKVTSMYHQREFNIWRNRITTLEFNLIVEKLNSMINGDEIHTSSWMPGNNWFGTVFEPIYTKACGMNEEESGLCFGLFVWYVFQERDDEWYFGKFEKDGIPIRGLTYFKKKL